MSSVAKEIIYIFLSLWILLHALPPCYDANLSLRLLIKALVSKKKKLPIFFFMYIYNMQCLL
jgi:hypothetical protein